MPTINWLATAVIRDVVAIQRVAVMSAANPNVVSRNVIRVAAFVILVAAMLAAPTVLVRMVRVLMVVAGSVREMALETATVVGGTGTAKSAVPVAIPIARDA